MTSVAFTTTTPAGPAVESLSTLDVAEHDEALRLRGELERATTAARLNADTVAAQQQEYQAEINRLHDEIRSRDRLLEEKDGMIHELASGVSERNLTIATLRREIRAAEERAGAAQRKVDRLSIDESLRARVDEAVSLWLYEHRDELVFDDGSDDTVPLLVATAIDDREHLGRYFRLDAAVRSLIRRGIEPTAILRAKCMRVHGGCGDADCRGCGASTDLVLPPKIANLIAEVRR